MLPPTPKVSHVVWLVVTSIRRQGVTLIHISRYCTIEHSVLTVGCCTMQCVHTCIVYV